jgi:hypothetical protein
MHVDRLSCHTARKTEGYAKDGNFEQTLVCIYVREYKTRVQIL